MNMSYPHTSHFRIRWGLTVFFTAVALLSLWTYSYGGFIDQWQQFIGQGTENLSCALIADINGDGLDEVVIGGRDGMVYAYNSSGMFVPGWPYPAAGAVNGSPAAGNLDADSAFEVVFGSEDGYVYVVNGNGSNLPGWPQECSAAVHDTPCIGDIDGDLQNDILVGTTDGYLYAWNASGFLLPGFPFQLGSSGAAIESSPCLGDMDQDDVMEIAVGCDDGYIYLLKYRMGEPEIMWKKRTGYFVRSSPAMGDIDGDGAYELVCGSDDFSMYAFESNGVAVRGWPVTTTYKLNFSSPALGDIDNDNVLEVVFGSGDGYIYAFDGNGLPVAGWTHEEESYSGDTIEVPGVYLGGRLLNSSVVLADINSDGVVDALIGSNNNYIYAVDGYGNQLTSEGFPFLVGGIEIYRITSAPALGNIDGDSSLELLIPSSDNILYCFELTNSMAIRADMPWPQFKQGPWRCSIYGYSGGVAELPSITLTDITEEVSGEVVIEYILSDRQGDILDMRPLYSLDYGKSWYDAKVISKTTGIGPSEYRGSIIWDSNYDMKGPEERRGTTDPDILVNERRDFRELKSVKFRVIPSDANGVGTGGETAVFHVDNNVTPTIEFTEVEGEVSGDVVFKYSIHDEEHDIVDLKVRYSIDGGETWKDASTTGQLEAIRPSRYDTGSFSWESDGDEPYMDSETVIIEVTAMDLDPGIPTRSNIFHLDNNKIPSILVSDIYEEVGGDVTIKYELRDREEDALSITCLFSADGGENFQQATLEGQVDGIPPSQYEGSIVWKSELDAPGTDIRTFQFRIIPKDNDEGKLDTSGNFHLDNNLTPQMTIHMLEEEQYGEFPITFSITDPEGDGVSLVCEYSDDGGAIWRNATVSGLLTDIKPADYDGSILWDSLVDLLGVDSAEVLFRITPSDADDGEPAVSPEIYVDNNAPPSVLLSDFTSEQSEDVEVFYTISDMEQDEISLLCKYSIDGGVNWSEATVSGALADIDESEYIGSLVWHSMQDVPNLFSNTTQFMIVPHDKDEGKPGTTTSFALDNNEPPTVAILEVIEEKTTGDVTIPFAISDVEGDVCSIYCEFSLDGGMNFNLATIIGDYMVISPSEYKSSVIWSSLVDAKGVDYDQIIFRITPSDLDSGEPSLSSPIHIDNNLVPDVLVSTPEGEQYSDILIDYTIHDEENDTLSLVCEWSEDGGETWWPATVSGLTDEIDSAGYIGSLYWHSKDDIPMVDQTDIRFRVIPWDNDEGIFGETQNFHLDNNERPSVELAELEQEQVGIVNVVYTIIDEEKDANEILCEYSPDGGFTWYQATVATETTIDPTTYSGVVRWVSDKDLPDVDRSDIMFKVTPFDIDPGFEGTVGPFHLDNNTPPSAQLQAITEEESGDVPLRFTLTDPNSDVLSLEVEYSTDGGQSWNIATVAGSTVNLEPTDYSGSVVWNSSLDLPGLDQEDVLVRVVPGDNDPGEPGVSNPFHLDNNIPPDITVSDIPEEIEGDVLVDYVIADDEGDMVSLQTFYSLDGGASWQEATVSQLSERLGPDDYFGTLTWNTAADLAGVDQKGILFKVIPSDEDEGSMGITAGMFVDNNAPPSVVVATPTEVTAGMVTINYTLSDNEGDTLKISGEFSLDGGQTWDPAKLEGVISGITPAGYFSTISWDSVYDMPGLDSSAVRFRIISADEDLGEMDETDDFRVDNNSPPRVTLEPIDYEILGDVLVYYTIEDIENDLVNITLEYSPDDGASWYPATYEGDTQNIYSMMYAGTLTWLSERDMANTYSERVALRIIPSDENVGEVGEITGIVLDNNDPPQVTVDIPLEGASGDVPISYTISDPEGDLVELFGEYSLDGGLTWSEATLSGITTDISPTNYNGQLTWHSSSDLPGMGLTTTVFSLTPADTDRGEPAISANFNLDNNASPQVSLGSPRVADSGDVEIPYELSDDEGDTLSFICEYSLDDGGSWELATILGLSTDLQSQDYSGVVIWAAVTDVGGQVLQGVRFRITPSDMKMGLSTEVAVGDMDLNRVPQITLINPWTEQKEQVEIDYTIYDPEGDVVDVVVDYSIDGGGTWKRATIVGGGENIYPEDYVGAFVWDAYHDLGDTEHSDVRLRVIPADTKEGAAVVGGSFVVDNNSPPSVSITGHSHDTDTGIALIDFTLTDAEGDSCELLCEFSEDAGLSWNPATIEGSTSGFSFGTHTISWLRGDDIPTTVGGERILFRITPADTDTGQSDEVEFGE